MRKSLIVFLFVAFGFEAIQAQHLERSEFQVGNLTLKIPFESISASLGAPDSVRQPPPYWDEFTTYYYPNIVVWVNNDDRTIWTLDIYDSTLSTARGVAIGDPVLKVDSLYGMYRHNINQREFERIGPYDSTFHNYDQWRLTEYITPDNTEGWLCIFFSKNGIVTKLLFYVGVEE